MFWKGGFVGRLDEKEIELAPEDRLSPDDVDRAAFEEFRAAVVGTYHAKWEVAEIVDDAFLTIAPRDMAVTARFLPPL